MVKSGDPVPLYFSRACPPLLISGSLMVSSVLSASGCTSRAVVVGSRRNRLLVMPSGPGRLLGCALAKCCSSCVSVVK